MDAGCPRAVLQAGMQNDRLATAESLSDDELIARLKALADKEREATTQLAAHLVVLARRVRRTEVIPPTSDLYELQLTMDADTFKKLRLVKELLGDEIPPCDDGAILELALATLLAELEN